MSRIALSRAFVCLCVVAWGSSSAWGQSGEGWLRFESKKHQFEASFPAAEVETMEADIVTHYFCAIPGTDTDFRVGVSDVAEQPANKEALMAELKRIQDEVVASLEGKIEESKEIESNGRIGLQFRLVAGFEGQDLVMTCRYYIVHSRLYQIMIVRTADSDLEDEQKKFFESFKIQD